MMQQRNRNLWEFYLKNLPNTDYIWVKLHEIKNLKARKTILNYHLENSMFITKALMQQAKAPDV